MQPTIQLGYDGMATQELRAALEHHGFHPTYSVLAPNLFDSWVDAAVRAFQKIAGLNPDGVVGEKTWRALYGQAGIPATAPLQGADPTNPTTVSDPGKFPTVLAPPGAPSGSSMPLILGLGALGALWLWWRNKKKGGTLAGLPFGNSEDDEDSAADAKKAEATAKRRARENAREADRQYAIELKRLQIDEEAQPGWAARIRRVVERAVEVDSRLNLSTPSDSIPQVAWQEATKERNAGRLTGGKQKLAKPEGKYRLTSKRAALLPATTGPSVSLRNRGAGEDEVWLERVENARGAKQGTKRIQISAKRYHSDRGFREREQEDARRIADSEGREVQLVNERGVALYKYQPNARTFRGASGEGRSPVDIEIDRASKIDSLLRFYKKNPRMVSRGEIEHYERERDEAMQKAERLEAEFKGTFKDITSERLIESVEKEAINRNCRKAVLNLFKVRPLAVDARTEVKLDKAAETVSKFCPDELREKSDADREWGEEAREEVGIRQPTISTREAAAAKLTKERATRHRKFTVTAIRREIEKGNISKDEGQELLRLAHDHEKAQEAERRAIFDPPRSTAKHVRKRRGEKDAHVYVSPEGRTRTLRK